MRGTLARGLPGSMSTDEEHRGAASGVIWGGMDEVGANPALGEDTREPLPIFVVANQVAAACSSNPKRDPMGTPPSVTGSPPGSSVRGSLPEWVWQLGNG